MFRKKEFTYKHIHGNGEYHLNYELTLEQQKASYFILENVKKGNNCILNAVTGAGKTEMIYPLIRYCVDNNLKVGIAIPRRDVVIELYERIKKDFKQARVISLYGGNINEMYGDVIVLTTHQLFRYDKYFDVIVVDEVDAFPFWNNTVLINFLINSVKGNIVYMSATIPNGLLKSGYPIYYLNRRYHKEKLDIPFVKYYFGYATIKKYIKLLNEGILIIYFPTIKQQIKFSKKLKTFHYVINSKTLNRGKLLNDLHNLNKAVVLSTLVLERGVTFKNTNVIVVNADHELFSYENLVQISGRVGRHYLYPHGKIIFLIKENNKKIKQAIEFIKKCNE